MEDIIINSDLEKYAKQKSINLEVLENGLQNEYLNIIKKATNYNNPNIEKIKIKIIELENAKSFLELTGISPSDETKQKIFESYINAFITDGGVGKWKNIQDYAKELGFEDVPKIAIIYGCNKCIENEQLHKLEYFKYDNKTIPEESIRFGFEHYASNGDYNSIFELEKHTELKPGDETYSAICKKIGLKEQPKT